MYIYIYIYIYIHTAGPVRPHHPQQLRGGVGGDRVASYIYIYTYMYIYIYIYTY